jgi:hypothetical protein
MKIRPTFLSIFAVWALIWGMSDPSTFAAKSSVNLVTSDLSRVQAMPNPWRSDRHSGTPVTFNNLLTGSTIKIFTASGHWVRTLNASTGNVTWDLTNNKGANVASGVYLYLVTAGSSQKAEGKIVVIK